MPKSLTKKQAAFRDAILAGFTPSQAYKKAFDAKGMSKASIAREANKLLHHKLVSASLKELTPIGPSTGAPIVLPVPSIQNFRTRQERMDELAHAAFLDPLDCFDELNHIKSLGDMPPHVRRAIASFKIDPVSFVTEVKFVDKLSAIMNYSKLAGDIPKEAGGNQPAAQAYDLSKLTDAEFREHCRLRKKAMITEDANAR